ncbi:hypothetical protein [Mycolicibacterium celeriflavum]|uniref:Uncharacterized protein n=1 Tax=Mycolicibacterium celeriflavum TaxID=1249101 RepID=A0A1X0C2D4_MYCCF|nr:hypothetical protein [Mycolicibacterium celeriflavum]MCV7239559.1 hypothetical protein [Mycolicibacterium celeriflavum]ORA51613.1 hypothetical protein BST21_00570 [Mycolicibacterium celeriflavum]BBY43251.1 hypothetical protein MCEL_15460 [Mycolicibacterium celeriflavum]
MIYKIPGADFTVRLSDQGGRAIILEICSIEGDKFIVPINPDTADDLGREILAGAMALNGGLAAKV